MKNYLKPIAILIIFGGLNLIIPNRQSEDIIDDNVIIKPTIIEVTNSMELIDDITETEDKQENIVEEEIEILPETYQINIKMVGDCLIHEGLYKAARKSDGAYNFEFMFEHIIDDIQAADIAIINQETIFTANRNNYSGYPTFGSPVEVGDAEAIAGFDIIAHATNHTIDKGIQGINDTLTFWNENHPDIAIIGIHNNEDESDILYKEVNNITLSFVNYTYGLNGLESRRKGKEYIVDLLTDVGVEDTLHEAVENSDMLIAILHVGTEYVYTPSTYEIQQVDKFIDNGASIVICAHPHVVEPFEIRTTENGNSAIVFYSLGNFISCQNKIPRVLGGMADIIIEKTIIGEEQTIEVIDFNMIPLVTHQERGYYTTYKLEDYTEELARKHKLGVTIEGLNNLWNSIMNK